MLRCEKNNEKLKKDVAGLIEANVRLHGEIKAEKDANTMFRKKNEHLTEVLELERKASKNAQQAHKELLEVVDGNSDSFWKRLQYLFTGKMYEKVIIVAIVLMLGFSSCSSDNDFKKGKRQLETQGYTNIKNTGYSFFCCSDEDNFSTGFEAVDKAGKKVKGCFCSSIGKGITIRFE